MVLASMQGIHCETVSQGEPRVPLLSGMYYALLLVVPPKGGNASALQGSRFLLPAHECGVSENGGFDEF